MDTLEKLGNQLSQVTMYDIKSYYNQAKNMVLNVSETEAKVREATNDDPWGASSTLMHEIASGTFNFQQFNEIMPCIYARFMDKEAKQWREIYKSLQLLEFLVKNGSERVVDDARSHISTIKMLRNFHYIDDKGKDQGINVRNRAKELSELLLDVDRIRTERRKAKANKNKYTGVGSESSFSSGGRYGGFGNDSYSGGGGGYNNDYNYNGRSGSTSGGFSDDTGRRATFEAYDAGDDEVSVRRSNSLASGSGGAARSAASASSSAQAKPPAAAKSAEKVVDLLGFDDDDAFGSSATTTKPAEKALPAVNANPLDDGDDDFDDFQAAPSSNPASPAPAPAAQSSQQMNLFEMLKSTSAPGTAAAVQSNLHRPTSTPLSMQGGPFSAGAPVMSPATRSTIASPTTPSFAGSMGGGMGMGTGMGFGGGMMSPTSAVPPSASSYGGARPAMHTASSSISTSAAKSPSSAGGFDDLWNMSLGSSGASAKPAAGGAMGNKSIKDLEKEKAAGIWGAKKGNGAAGAQNSNAFGGFGSGLGTSSSNGGGDDLLL